MADLTSDPSLGTTSTIGRYFGVVSTVPSLIGTTWLYLLFVLRPWQSPLDWSALATNNPIAQPLQGLALIAVAITIAVVTHPIQFIITQAMEGYWGSSHVGLALAYRRALTQARRRETSVALQEQALAAIPPTDRRGHPWSTLMRALTFTASTTVIGSYPANPDHILPTRLGNVLRRYETRGGKAIDLPILDWATYIGMVADPGHTAYVQDQRQEMDLAVRMTAVSLFCAMVSTIALWPHGLWLLLAVLPFAAAWISYRGALSAAHAYGQAFEAWLYLNRFKLYEQLHLPAPRNSYEERRLNEVLDMLVQGDDAYEARYRRPSNDKPTG
ncbi:hypothetical protein [Leifsonia sp. PS1209]|uniref:hypothetical protein n=1 Tax=Leifsonia sp. PS1209 TaxID=2724914 RepID=UPI001442C7E5|nr:hypothetical protein [Leifsonia sp. PS1209]QIZ97830.1 hypothetical protein HF024_04380 [Leifsonia sp. PS1209]